MKNATSSLDLSITVTAPSGRRFVPYLRRHVLAAHAFLKSPLVELSVALVGDKTMSELHVQFMSIDEPTDVLTFPLEVNARGRATSGEVVVCVPEARRRAKAHRTDLARELLLYAIHGMLHLDGYDDQTDADFRTMHAAEDDILQQIGVGPAGVGKPPPQARAHVKFLRRPMNDQVSMTNK